MILNNRLILLVVGVIHKNIVVYFDIGRPWLITFSEIIKVKPLPRQAWLHIHGGIHPNFDVSIS
jgi:hypothetical protein